jgi:hypothetical protein
MPNFNLSTLSTGILTIILTVSISNPKNVNKVVGPTVLLSARGTSSSWQMFLKTSINNAQFPDPFITHLSFPEGSGVNSYIAEEYCKVKYSSFDGVLDMISSLGKGAELGKIDIKQAFRLLIVNPTDFDLLGIQFEGKYWNK